MSNRHWIEVVPGLVIGVGILVASFVAKATEHSPAFVMTGPLLLALSVLAADLLNARLLGLPRRPGAAALMMAGSVVLMGLLLTLSDAHTTLSMLPVVGAVSWIALWRETPQSRKHCP